MVEAHNLTPELLLRAYAVGLFPMAYAADSPDLYWVDPEMRGILPWSGSTFLAGCGER